VTGANVGGGVPTDGASLGLGDGYRVGKGAVGDKLIDGWGVVLGVLEGLDDTDGVTTAGVDSVFSKYP